MQLGFRHGFDLHFKARVLFYHKIAGCQEEIADFSRPRR